MVTLNTDPTSQSTGTRPWRALLSGSRRTQSAGGSTLMARTLSMGILMMFSRLNEKGCPANTVNSPAVGMRLPLDEATLVGPSWPVCVGTGLMGPGRLADPVGSGGPENAVEPEVGIVSQLGKVEDEATGSAMPYSAEVAGNKSSANNPSCASLGRFDTRAIVSSCSVDDDHVSL